MTRIANGLALGVAALALLAACSLTGCSSAEQSNVASLSSDKSSSKSSDSGKSAEPVEADPVKFASCMREHGIDMPDPDPNNPSISVIVPPEMSKDDADAAFKACDKFMGATEASGASTIDIKKVREYAKCMRENGVPDFPDPDASGGLSFKVTADSSSANPMGDDFAKADKLCNKLMQPTETEGGGS